MHPAYSVIFFTTASGAGYGALFLLGINALFGHLPTDRWLGFAGLAVALGLVTAGLLSSTLHLGHPERAWRAMSQWRSSWLSREGLLALVTFVPAGLFGIGWVIVGQTDGAWGWFGGIAAVLSLLTVYATGMIYASLKPIPNWCNGWVAPIYIAFSLVTGATWLYAMLRLFGLNPYPLAIFGAVFGAVAWAAKVGYWRFIDTSRSLATTATATGLGVGSEPVRLLDAPHLEENFLQREMGYQIARKHAEKLRRIALIAGIGAMVLLLIAGASEGLLGTLAALLAVSFTALAVLIERWLFFAEAKHAVTLYYGNQSL